MKLTRHGICYDLAVSPYNYSIRYPNDQNVKFMFSSQLNLDKFVSRIANNRKQINTSLTNRFKVNINYDILCDIVLYEKVESRGFYVMVNGKGIEWLEEAKLDGVMLTRGL